MRRSFRLREVDEKEFKALITYYSEKPFGPNELKNHAIESYRTRIRATYHVEEERPTTNALSLNVSFTVADRCIYLSNEGNESCCRTAGQELASLDIGEDRFGPLFGLLRARVRHYHPCQVQAKRRDARDHGSFGQ